MTKRTSWVEHFERCATSRKSKRSYCEEHNLSYKSFFYQQRKQDKIDDGAFEEVPVSCANKEAQTPQKLRLTPDLQPVNFSAERLVKFIPGFKATASTNRFRAYINRTSGYVNGENAQVLNEYNLDCAPFPYRSAVYSPDASDLHATSLMSVTGRDGHLLVQNAIEVGLAEIEIYDATGHVIFNASNRNLNEFTDLPVGYLSAGIYIYRQITSMGSEEKKFLIVH